MDDAASLLVALLVLAVSVPLAHQAGRVYAEWLIDRPGRPCTDTAPYGVGPCGVARVTYPSLYGLNVRELG